MGKKKEILGKGSKSLNEFKEFISKGNVIDLAVGVIIGGAFGKIVTSVVNDILMPLIGIVIGGINFTGLTFKIKDATIYYGMHYVFLSLLNLLVNLTKKKKLRKK